MPRAPCVALFSCSCAVVAGYWIVTCQIALVSVPSIVSSYASALYGLLAAGACPCAFSSPQTLMLYVIGACLPGVRSTSFQED